MEQKPEPEKPAQSLHVATKTCGEAGNAAKTAAAGGRGGGGTPAKLYKMRLFVLAQFCLLSFSSAYQWITFAPQASLFASYYGVGGVWIDYLSTAYMYAYAIGVIPGLFLTDRIDERRRRRARRAARRRPPGAPFSGDNSGEGGGGVRAGLVIAASLNTLGAGLRFFGAGPDRFTLLFVGQFFSAVAQVFILGIPPSLASTWFGQDERNTATSVGVVANNLGVAAGYLLTTIFVKTTEDIVPYLRFQFLFCLAIFVLMAFALKSNPPTPPSASQLVLHTDHDEKQESKVAKSIRNLFSRPPFRYLFLTYGIVVGGSYAVTTVLESIISPKFSTPEMSADQKKDLSTQIGILGVVLVVCGIASGLLVGIILDKTAEKFKLMGRVLAVCTTAGLVWFSISVEHGGWTLVYISSAAYGCFSAAMIPAAFQFAGQLFFPIDDDIVAGLLNASAQVFGIVFITVMGMMRNNELAFPMRNSVWFMAGLTVLGIVLQFRVDGFISNLLAYTSPPCVHTTLLDVRYLRHPGTRFRSARSLVT